MERILFVTFENVVSAKAALRSLNALDRNGTIALYVAMLGHNENGTFRLDSPENGTSRSRVSAAMRRFLRAMEGNRRDSDALEAEWIDVDGDFVGDAYAAFSLRSTALIADIDEDRVTPVDSRMEALDGTVLRRARNGAADTMLRERLALIDAEIALLDVEHVHASSARRAKLKATASAMLARRERMIGSVAARQNAQRAETEEKVEILNGKIARGGQAAVRHQERLALLAGAYRA